MHRPRRLTPFIGLLAFCFVISLAPTASAAVAHHYDDAWGDTELTLVQTRDTGLEVLFSLRDWTLGDIEIAGRGQSTLTVPGLTLQNEAGAPNIPGLSRYIALPNGARASVRVVSSRIEVLKNVDLAPAPVIPLETEDGPLVYEADAAIYGVDAFYPAEAVVVSEVREIRGVDAAILAVRPFQYNPVTDQLRVLRDLRLEVDFTDGDGRFGEDRLRNRWWDAILDDVLLNAASLPALEAPVAPGQRTPDHEYVIICPDDPAFTAWADTLKVFRTEQGIRTGVYTTTDVGGNTTAAIEAFVNDAYLNWDLPPAAVLLLGDYGTGGTGVNSPRWDSYCLSDNMYADVDGDDLPEMAFARITARNAAELETMIGKALDYERQPPTAASFYQNPVMAGGWQTERWFVLCTETIYGFMANELGKTPIREYAIYDGNANGPWSTATNTSTVVSYFGSAGLGYIPDTPAHLTDWGANATRLNNDINAGTFSVLHRDHGGNDGWGEPDYTNGDLAGLSNEDLTFVFSINCLTGEYDISGECFAEAFHRHAQGALGLIAASETSYSFVNDTYIWGMYDYYWPDFDPGYGTTGEHDLKPAYGNAAGKYYLEASNWPYNTSNKVVTYHLFHHHGDAFMSVYSEQPQALAVSHDGALLSGIEFFTVAADAGSWIGLSSGGEFLGAAAGSGSPETIAIPAQLPGGDLVITVTKQNHYRYRAEVPIIPPEGPFVVFQDCLIDDSAESGNGALDYGESVQLDMTVQNVGLETARRTTAVVACADDYVTLTDDTAAFGDIAASSSASTPGAFALSVGTDVPDGHRIDFILDVTDADSTYTSYFNIIAHAPVLDLAAYTIEDGDNDILDPGDAADLTVELENLGSARVAGLQATLAALDTIVSVDGGVVDIPLLAPGQTLPAVFQISAHPDAQIGDVAELQLDVVGSDYEYHTSLTVTVGLTIEDFETATFANLMWEPGGNEPWFITDVAPQEGTYCAQSGDIGDGESSVLSTTFEVVAPGEISFWYKISSESSYDYLRFSVDGSELGSWSGSVGWTEAVFPVSAGTRTFTWSYTKDGSVSTGSDCGWIDYIVFPAVGAQPAPIMSCSGSDLEIVLAPGETDQRAVQIINSGEGELNYMVTLEDPLRLRDDTPAPLYKKDQAVHTEGEGPGEGSGGPDTFGYYWTDSDEPGGPVFDWVEINTLGAAAGTGDDASLGPFDLGFTFLFYGVAYDQVRICTNGFLTFSTTSTTYSNGTFPNSSSPNEVIAPFWDDLNPNSGGTIWYYADTANSRFIAEWEAIPHYSSSGTGTYTFQAILNANGSIVCQYLDMIGDVNLATIGIENLEGSDGLQVVYNAAYMHDDLALSFAAATPWLQIQPMSGIVAPSGDVTLDLIYCAEDVEVGDYFGLLKVHGNDPDNLVDELPVTLYVRETTAVGDQEMPRAFALGHARPNPFNPSTTIGFALPRTGHVELKIYDVAGRLVRRLVDGEMPAGHHAAVWRGENDQGRQVASGTYYYLLDCGDFTETRKMTLVK
ncbi:hypothetical protein H8E07_09495 [bacterium]|nr:hypothetical protein [bacterium]